MTADRPHWLALAIGWALALLLSALAVEAQGATVAGLTPALPGGHIGLIALVALVAVLRPVVDRVAYRTGKGRHANGAVPGQGVLGSGHTCGRPGRRTRRGGAA